MRYNVNFDKVVNQLVPAYIGGRKLILFIQSLVSPLRSLNDEFVSWAKETRIEASMTSQVFKLEWYLNRKFKKYFKDKTDRISIIDNISIGVPLYWQDANVTTTDNMLLYKTAGEDSSIKDTDTTALYFKNEITDLSGWSFIVYSPAIDEALITTDNYQAMLSFYIDKYKLANKTYRITFDTSSQTTITK